MNTDKKKIKKGILARDFAYVQIDLNNAEIEGVKLLEKLQGGYEIINATPNANVIVYILEKVTLG